MILQGSIYILCPICRNLLWTIWKGFWLFLYSLLYQKVWPQRAGVSLFVSAKMALKVLVSFVVSAKMALKVLVSFIVSAKMALKGWGIFVVSAKIASKIEMPVRYILRTSFLFLYYWVPICIVKHVSWFTITVLYPWMIFVGFDYFDS